MLVRGIGGVWDSEKMDKLRGVGLIVPITFHLSACRSAPLWLSSRGPSSTSCALLNCRTALPSFLSI